MKNKYLTLMILLILIGLIIMQNVLEHRKKTEAGLSNSHIKGQAVSFSLNGLDGLSYEIDGKREKPLILNFWESWCDPCKKEAPNLKLFYEKYKGQFDLYAVNATNRDTLESVKNFVSQYSLPFPILLDNKGNVDDLYHVSLFPTTFLIDRNGKIVDVIHFLDAKELDRKITKLINS